MKKANEVKYTWCLKGLKWKRWAAIWINSEEKTELDPSHAVIPPPSISHTRRSGNPVGWFDILSSGWLCFPQVHPLQTSATRTHTHTRTHARTHKRTHTHGTRAYSLFPEFMGQWRTGHQGCRKDSEELVQPTWWGEKNKRSKEHDAYKWKEMHKPGQQTEYVLCKCCGWFLLGLEITNQNDN